jgi:PEP-CTERM motif/NHL repeat
MKRYRLITACSLAVALLMTSTSSGGITLTLNRSISGFSNLDGIGVDSAGNILATDSGRGRVFKFSQTGNLQKIKALLGAVHDITAGASGNIFVTTGSVDQIIKLNSNFGQQPNVPAPGSRGRGIATFSNGDLVVSDRTQGKIYTLNSTGTTTISQFTAGAPLGSFIPLGVATTSTNQILVADPASNTLARYSSTGTLQQTANFSDPSGVATDNAGNIYLADGNSNTIRVLNSNLVEQSSFSSASKVGFAEDVAWASNGRLIASAGNQIRVYDTGFTSSGNETLADGTVLSGTFNAGFGDSVTVAGNVTARRVVNTGSVTIDSGATLTTTNGWFDNRVGSVLTVDGTLDSSLVLQSNSTLTGSGTVNAPLTVRNGITLAPGNSPGTLAAGNTTFGAGGTFELEVNDFTGTAGADPGWDLLAVTGTLNITSTIGDPFIVDVNSLTLANAAGNAENFNDASNFSLTFVTTTLGITNFAANLFSIDTSGFTNAFTGVFSIAQLGNDLALQYTAATAAVPEPSSFAILGLALIGFGITYQRKRRRASART